MESFFRTYYLFYIKKSMNNYTFKELNILSQYHFKYYRSFLKRKEYNQAKKLPLECAYAYTIQYSIDQLNEDERRILVTEFIDGKHNNWWMEYFSKTSYYRIKRNALTRFIHCLHNEIVV